MKKRKILTIGFTLLIGLFVLTAFTKSERSITPANHVYLEKQPTVKKSYYTNFGGSQSLKLKNLRRVLIAPDCSTTTWASVLNMTIEYNPANHYNNFYMNFSGNTSGAYVLEYSIWGNGPNYGFMGSGTIHNFARNYNYMFPVSLPSGDYAFDCILKNECGEDVSDPMEFLFTNEDIE